MHAALRNRKRVARGVAPDDERKAPDVAFRRATEALDAIGRFGLPAELLETDNFLSDPENVPEFQMLRLVRLELQVDAVERAFVLDDELRAPPREGRVARGKVTVAAKIEPVSRPTVTLGPSPSR